MLTHVRSQYCALSMHAMIKGCIHDQSMHDQSLHPSRLQPSLVCLSSLSALSPPSLPLLCLSQPTLYYLSLNPLLCVSLLLQPWCLQTAVSLMSCRL
mmetsp:Transcript_29474/g.43190  ORF Transcript_29474/g.43190 Transcript_29474/m.43190 type:complete len:97 (+) Transcript_29474:3-293(+)